MQESQNVHLDPRETGPSASEINRATQLENLRKRRTHSDGGSGVQFSTIFGMVDSSLEIGAESLRKIPKRNSSKETEPPKSSDLPAPTTVESKTQTPEAPKEAPKAKVEQEQKPRAARDTEGKKSEVLDKIAAQVAVLQAKIDAQVQQAARHVERIEIKIDRRDVKAADKPKAQERIDLKPGSKELKAEAVFVRKDSDTVDRGQAADPGKPQDRRVRQKSKDDADAIDQSRDARRQSEGPKTIRADEESSRQQKVRERPDEKQAAPDRAESRDAKPAPRKLDETDFTVQKHSDENGQTESGKKKKGIGDLEKLTGLHAKSAVEAVPIAPVIAPVQDIALKSALESASKGIAVDALKASAKPAVSNSSAGSQQNAGGADGQGRAAQSQDKLGQTARRLTSYLSGKPEAAIKPEATFSDMVAKAKLFVENGRSEMTIQLKPEQLGNLNIKMVVEDGKMQAQFVTDRAEVKALIEENADMLKTKLSEVGIEINALSVEVRSDAGQANPQDGRSGGLRRGTEFGSGEDSDLPQVSSDARLAYALAGMGTHLSLVA